MATTGYQSERLDHLGIVAGVCRDPHFARPLAAPRIIARALCARYPCRDERAPGFSGLPANTPVLFEPEGSPSGRWDQFGRGSLVAVRRLSLPQCTRLGFSWAGAKIETASKHPCEMWAGRWWSC
jgi:hypothetical protein